MKKLSVIVVSCLLSLGFAQAQTGEQYLQQQLELAKAGNYWAKVQPLGRVFPGQTRRDQESG